MLSDKWKYSINVLDQELDKPFSSSALSVGTDLSSSPVRFMIDIRMTGGMHIRQRDLSYEGLKNLVEKLEGPF